MATEQEQEGPALGQCAWCSHQAVTKIWIEGGPGKKKQKMAEVCVDHERQFVRDGALSERQEFRRMYASKKEKEGRL